MPQATDEQRLEWGGEQGVGDDKAIAYLEDRGYRRTRDWQWFLPFSIAWPTLKDWGAIDFLVDEWDWGGLTLTPPEGW